MQILMMSLFMRKRFSAWKVKKTREMLEFKDQKQLLDQLSYFITKIGKSKSSHEKR